MTSVLVHSIESFGDSGFAPMKNKIFIIY